tara:strand:+ start:76 stop:570 length:495 start_codon:yes stop_codon:yes gene_type:complete
MSKYNITINEINTDNDQHTAQGTILKNGEPVAFEAATIWYDGTRRWKVKEEGGLAVKTTESNFSTGERMAVARWLKAVSKDEELVGKSSGQGSGGSGGRSSSRVKELEAQNEALQGQVAELMAMVTEFVASQSASQQASESQIEEEVAEAPADKPKRKSRSKKK